MSIKVLTRIIFIFWMIAITVLSIMPHQDDSIIKNSNLTKSGMEKHFIAYFIAASLCYFSYRRNTIKFVLFSSLLLFLFSLILELVQFILPYRTFNIRDVYANAVGIILFFIAWTMFQQIRAHNQKI